MSELTGDQLNGIVDMIIDENGTLLSGSDVSEITGLILENIPGLETADSSTLTQIINDIRNRYYESISQTSDTP